VGQVVERETGLCRILEGKAIERIRNDGKLVKRRIV